MHDDLDSHEISEVKDPQIPEKIYVNLEPRFASLVATIPSLDTTIPENPSLKPDGALSITLENNGRYKIDPNGYQGLKGIDWDKKSNIEKVKWGEREISGEELLKKRKELLNESFVEALETPERVVELRAAQEAAGLMVDSFLYRAVTIGELERIQANRSAYFSHLDPSANFENEDLYSKDESQVKSFAHKKDQGYSGKIVRWKIEDPLLYRHAGMQVRRIVPMFSHYLRNETIEVSSDGGVTFVPVFGDTI